MCIPNSLREDVLKACPDDITAGHLEKTKTSTWGYKFNNGPGQVFGNAHDAASPVDASDEPSYKNGFIRSTV